MTNRPRPFTSSSGLNLPHHRSHSCREKSTRSDSRRRRVDQELHGIKNLRSDSFLSPNEYLENIRTKMKIGYNQLMQQKVEEVEEYMNQRQDEERRLSRRKFRKTQIENENIRRQSINEIVRERDAICEEKLAAQRSLYNRLLNEQAQRLYLEKNLQSFETLNITQLKDRLTRVEHSNEELKNLLRYLIKRQPVHTNTVYIPHFAIMSIVSATMKNKKKLICHVPTANQFENIKPIEVKCFLNDHQITIETEKQQTEVTATMMTIVPQAKRPISAPTKKQTIAPVTDMVVAKPIRHLAILPSSKEQVMKGFTKHPTNLSETFTMYEGPSPSPNVGRSLDETLTIDHLNQISDSNCEMPINVELKVDDLNLCDNTTISSICELVDQPKMQQKPHSLIGRYQLPPADSSSKLPPSVHIATVYYGEAQSSEAANKQVLIQQFYTQLEKMKATFNTDSPPTSHQITTNTLTFDNGQVRQTSATKQLKEKTTIRPVSTPPAPETIKKPPLPKKQRTRKNPSTRIQSAPVTMPSQSNQVTNSNPCKQRRHERIPIPTKKSIPTPKAKPIQRIESAPATRIEFHGSEVTLLPHEEEECRQMFEKLQRLQPNGVCVDMNTLRRALYPPVGTTAYSAKMNHDQTTSAFKSYRQRADEMPQSWIKMDNKYVSQYVAKQPSRTSPTANESNLTITLENTNIDRITDQVKKHAAINYSYYTRTK